MQLATVPKKRELETRCTGLKRQVEQLQSVLIKARFFNDVRYRDPLGFSKSSSFTSCRCDQLVMMARDLRLLALSYAPQ
jgi:hypothetical protein